MTLFQYTPVAHFNGTLTSNVSVTERIPWIYIIASLSQKILYVGETYDDAGLTARLSSHFGRALNSSLKKCAAGNAGVRHIKAPYLVIAARLPFDDDSAPFNGENKKVRKACEAVMHEIVTKKFILPNNWTIVSSASTTLTITDEMSESCDDILKCFIASHTFFENLSSETLPFNLVLLDRVSSARITKEVSIGDVIEDIELQLFDWVIDVLKNEYSENWWTAGINKTIRKECASRQEDEGSDAKVPKWAYFTLIDILNVIKNNWLLFCSVMEEVSSLRGKNKAANWIIYINEARKLWAHPLKQRYVSVNPADIAKIQEYQSKLRIAISSDG